MVFIKIVFLVPGPSCSLPTPMKVSTFIPLAVWELKTYLVGIPLALQKFFVDMQVLTLFFIFASILEPAYFYFCFLLIIILCKKENNAMKLLLLGLYDQWIYVFMSQYYLPPASAVLFLDVSSDPTLMLGQLLIYCCHLVRFKLYV